MRLRTQLFIIFSLIIISVVATIGCFLYRDVSAILFEQLRTALTGYASSASMLIDGDRHSLLITPAHIQLPYFLELRGKLRAFIKIDPHISEIYTMVKSDKPDVWKFVVDAAERRDKDGDGKTLVVTVSIGVFSVSGGEEVRPEDAVTHADAALYLAKEAGRNRISV
jgi:GGDEF domain-containing protein